jgi:hypothetical protein
MESAVILEKRLLGFQAVYGEWIDRSAKHAKLALDAGVEERKVRIAEQQGELIPQVIRSVLGDLGLNSKQQSEARPSCAASCWRWQGEDLCPVRAATFLRTVHGWFVILRIALWILATWTGWVHSVAYVAHLSQAALVLGNWSAWQAAASRPSRTNAWSAAGSSAGDAPSGSSSRSCRESAGDPGGVRAARTERWPDEVSAQGAPAPAEQHPESDHADRQDEVQPVIGHVHRHEVCWHAVGDE